MRSDQLIGAFLEETGTVPAPAVAGGMPRGPALSREQHEALLHRIEIARVENAKLANVVFVAHFAVLAVAIVAAWMQRDNAKFLLAVLGGAGGIFLILLAAFRSFWKDKATYDMLSALLPGATSDEALKMIQAIWLQAKARK